MSEIILKDESYTIVGICMEVNRELGMGFKEAVYKEALEIELKNQDIPYEREKLFTIEYKGKYLRQKYQADFFLFDQIVLEIKATSFIVDAFVAQTINYLKASALKLLGRGGPGGDELFELAEAAEHLFVEVVGLVVEVCDLHLGLDVDVVLDVAAHLVLLDLPVLADEDEGREEDGFEADDHRQKPERERVEAGESGDA